MSDFPRVLVAAPTASAKKYCFSEWLDNVMAFDYPNFNVVLFDNTKDNGEFTQYMNQTHKDNYNSGNFIAANSLKLNNSPAINVIEKMCLSHNDCRKHTLFHNYDYLLHLETDVFPEKDVIQRLIFNKKRVVGAIYYRDEGRYRKPMLQRFIEPMPKHIQSVNFESNEDTCFIDGTLKQVSHVGLGCVLIENKVLKKIPFRFEKQVEMHPDSFFAEDCLRNGIPIYADTSIICRHDNQEWGTYGVDYK
jgi:hypothetical protein